MSRKTEVKNCSLCMKAFLEGQEGSLKWTTEAQGFPTSVEAGTGNWDIDFCSVKCLKIWLELKLEQEKLNVLKDISGKLDKLLQK